MCAKSRPSSEINYKGLNAVSQSDVLERFKKAKVGVTVESQYDPTRIKRAEVVLKQLLAEHGHQFATVRTEIKTIPPAACSRHLHRQGRAHGQGRQDRLPGQQPHQQPHAAGGHEEPRSPSAFRTPSFLRTCSRAPLTRPSWTKTRSASAQAYREKGYFKAQTGDPTPRCATAGGINIFTMRPSTGKRDRHPDAGRRGRALQAGRHQLHRQQERR